MLDYEQIRQQNIGLYGTDITNYGPLLLANLYSERTHFIFELLQNAQDAGAAEITFALFKDRLEVRHDGRPFQDDDVKSICSIAHSTKKNDLTQIGKFGIGFKAVYAYTRTPQIYSAQHSFEIQDFVHPHPCQPRAKESDQTLFVFPFDHLEISPQQAKSEISEGLAKLENTILLFLTNLCVLNVEIDGKPLIRHQKSSSPTQMGERIALQTEAKAKDAQDQRWWVVKHSGADVGARAFTVQLAFLLEADGRIKKVRRSPVFVSFPTEKVFPVGFLLNAPYRTTPARDNIPGDDPWNIFLSEQLANLACDAYRLLREERRLDLGSLDALPLISDPHPLYRPIYEQMLNLLKSEPFLLDDRNDYVLGQNCWIPRGEELRKIFPSKELPRLTGTEVAWVAEGLGANYPALTTYLVDNEICRRVPPEHLIELLSEAYLERQLDSWMIEFYSFLNTHRALRQRLRDKPIARTESGQQLCPFDKNWKPLVFLPGAHPTSFPTLKREFANHPIVKSYFNWLGLREPDILDEVRQQVLPKYADAKRAIDWLEHREDLKIISAALNQAPRHSNLKEELKLSNLVACEPGSQVGWVPVNKAYIKSDEILNYFTHSGWARFASSDYDTEDQSCLRALGVEDTVRISRRKPGAQNYVKVLEGRGEHVRGVDGFDPDFWVDSLDLVLAEPSVSAAVYLWNEILVGNASCLEGFVEKSSAMSFPPNKTRREQKASKAGKLLLSSSWLPTPQGTFCRPSELSLDDLPPEFVRSEALASKLKMKSTAIGALAKEAGLDPKILEYAIRNQAKLRDLQSKEEKDARLGSTPKPVNYAQNLIDTMNRPAASVPSGHFEESVIDSGAVRNADLRRERLSEDVAEAKAAEPGTAARVHRSVQRIYECKDEATRAALQAWYQGRCQICQDGFAKRNGKPYFEALYLIKNSQVGWVDRPGNALALCPSCVAKFEHGTVEAPDLIEQILAFKTKSEGGTESPSLRLKMCGKDCQLSYCEKHLLELQVLASEGSMEAVLVEN